MAWSQGDDLYGMSDNRFLKAAEYVARYNNTADTETVITFRFLLIQEKTVQTDIMKQEQEFPVQADHRADRSIQQSIIIMSTVWA